MLIDFDNIIKYFTFVLSLKIKRCNEVQITNKVELSIIHSFCKFVGSIDIIILVLEYYINR